jgi:anhydro-N-acetylmuramic acid kinase
MTTLKVLGMMSGTSGDAIDGALMEFSRNGNWQLLWFDSCPFSSQEFARIKKLMQGADAREVTLGASYMAELYAHACRQFFADKRVRPDYIAAHGQTVYHHPHPEN